MSKKLLLSPAAAGKTTYAVELALQSAESLRAEVRVCVPTGLQARAWRDRLAAAGGAIGIHVLTFDRLVAACLDEAGEAYTELTEPVQYRLLRSIISRLPLQHYAPLKSKSGFIQVTQQVISELKSGLIDPAPFTRAVIELGNEPRLRELADIYAAYQQKLRDQGWADRVGLHWLAVEALKERAADACRDWPLLIVDGFDDFNSSQLALLQLLAGRVEEFIMTLPQAENVDYGRYRSTRQEVEDALDIIGQKLPLTDLPRSPALHHLANKMFALSISEPLETGAEIMLCEAPDRAAEVRAALRWLKQRIVYDDIAPNQVALLARNIVPYRGIIRQIAAEFGLPIRLVDGLPLSQSPVLAALMELLRLFLPTAAVGGPNLARRPLISAWRSPYFAWQDNELTITAADADILDILAREQRVIRGLDQWQAAFSAGLAAKDEELQEEEAIGRTLLTRPIVQQLQDKFDYFLTVTQPPPTADSMRSFVRWLERIIGPDPHGSDKYDPPPDSLEIIARARANPETTAVDVAALQTFKEILRGLVWAEEAVGQTEPVTFIAFFNELSGAIAAATFFLPAGDSLAELLVANATQVRGLSFQAVAVLGLSEGSFPATISEDTFLRDADRRRLRQQFALSLEPSTQSAEREFFYEAITRPRQKLLLTRPILAENGAEWVASPFWEAVRGLISSTPQHIPSEAVLPLAETASWPEWWETIAASAGDRQWGQSRDPATWRQIQTAAQIWQARLAGEPSIWDGDLRALSPRLAEEHGPDRVWSASRLELARKCGFMFYTRYILDLQPRPEPAEGLDARQLGSIYHDIFERVTKAKGLDLTDEAQVRKVVLDTAGPILDAAPQEEGFRETPWWPQTRLEIMDNVIASVLALAEGSYQFQQAELSFGFSSPPLRIADGGDTLQLRGFIDRLDRDPDGRVRIIDYKLGGKTTFTKTAFAKGEKLQLPLYALAAQETLRVGTVEDGFYWHFRQAEDSPFHLATAPGGVKGAIAAAVEFAWEAVHQVRDGRFAPRPPEGGCPTYCPAAGFCWRYAPVSW